MICYTSSDVKVSSPRLQQQRQQQAQNGRGRPRLGTYRLECMLPKYVRDELMRVEIESEVYRTRVAANVLCEWAQQKAFSRSAGLMHQI
jgi:hypothetical protein